MSEEIRAILREHTRLPVEVAALDDDDDLYEAGLSSYDTVHLMLALEDRFGVEFPDSMLHRRSFESIASMCAAVAGLQAGKEGA